MASRELDLLGLQKWVPHLVQDFSDKQIILLSGTLGAGKTAFTRDVLSYLGCKEVSSPTYGLIHEYKVPNCPHCYHVDLYRLQDDEDLESTGFWELFSNPSGLIFIEWADRISEDLYPLQWSKWAIEVEKGTNDSSRLYTLRKL